MSGNAVTLMSGRRWLASTFGFLVAPPVPLADRVFVPGTGSSGPDDGGANCHDSRHDERANPLEATLAGQLVHKAVFGAVILGCLVFVAGASAQTLTVDLTRPATGATVQAGSVTLEATATGAAYVEFWADGVKLAQDTTAPYTATWNATAGIHRVAAVANDGQGRDGVWDGHRVVDTHSVTAQAGVWAQTLTVDLTRPANGATVQAGSVTLEATATGAAYVEFWADDVKLAQDTTAPYSATWNASVGAHQVAALANDGQGVDDVINEHRVVDRHRVTVQASQPPPVGSSLPLHRHTLDPGETHIWTVHDSSGTEIYPPGPGGRNVDKHGTIRWEPGGKYANTPRTYFVLGFRVTQGSPGRMFDWHNQPADAPHGWDPPHHRGGPPTLVAPFAIDWFKGNGWGLRAATEANDWPGPGPRYSTILSDEEMAARMGQMIWLWVEITWGRIDGASPTNGPGGVRVWLAGEDTPRVNLQNINTTWVDQGMVTFWTGSYWCSGCSSRGGAPERGVVEIAGPRVGLTPKAAYEDKPVVYPDQSGHWGNGLHQSLSPTSGDVPVPARLAW
jgi:hypothetical protein